MGCCEHGDEPLGSIICGGFLDRLRNCWLQLTCALCRRCYTIHCEYTRILQAHICKCALYGACLNITYQVHRTMSQFRPLFFDTGPQCVWRLTGQLHIREVPSSGLVRKTDFLEVFGSHQGLMLLFLSEAHTCTVLQGLRWLLLVDTELLSSGIKRSGPEAGHSSRTLFVFCDNLTKNVNTPFAHIAIICLTSVSLQVLSEAYACTALQGLPWLLLVDTTGVVKLASNLRLVLRLGMIGAVPRLVHTPDVIQQCITC